MIVVRYDCELWMLRKPLKDLINVFKRNCPKLVLGARATGHISKSKLHKKIGSIPLSSAVTKERLRRTGHLLQKKDDRGPKNISNI